jgi:hypothetical protein
LRSGAAAFTTGHCAPVATLDHCAVALDPAARLLAGCGDSDDANTISQRLSAEQSSDEDKLHGVAPILREAHDRSLDGLEELRHVPVPKADEARIKAFIRARERQTELLGEAADAAGDADAQKFTAAEDAVTKAATGAQSTARGYGFRECGRRAG